MAAGLGSSGGDAADCCLPDVISDDAAISAGGKPAMEAGLWSLEVLQQTAVLPTVISYAAAVSACEPSVRVGSASNGSRPWVFWR